MIKKQALIAATMAVLSCVSRESVAADSYNELGDAIMSQVQAWQSGAKAKPLMSSDGKVIFPFGQGMPQLTCSPERACDIELEPGETPVDVIRGDSAHWAWKPTHSVEGGQTVNHIVLQPNDNDLESNVIVTTDRRTYHIKVYSPHTDGVYLNRIGFYYPDDLVTSWESKAGKAAQAAVKEHEANVMPTAVSPDKMAFDYKIEGDADFRPLRVFSDGERTYIAMPDDIRHSEYPTLSLIDPKGNLMVVNYRRTVDESSGTIYFVVDKLFNQAELHRDDEKVRITWQRKAKKFFSFVGGGN
jgi:type IV secretion system protein VirB9